MIYIPYLLTYAAIGFVIGNNSEYTFNSKNVCAFLLFWPLIIVILGIKGILSVLKKN